GLAATNEDLRKRVPPLVKTALDTPALRPAVIEAAARLGPAAKDLTPALTKLAADGEQDLRARAKDALEAVEGKAPAASVVPQATSAVAWLAKAQKPDGRYLEAEASPYQQVVTAAFCGLTLLATGDPYPAQLERAADYVAKHLFIAAKDFGFPAAADRSNWTV